MRENIGFNKQETEYLLVKCGRRCCICGEMHRVQVHHIKPKEKGGSDNIENGIPLCPKCHNEVHIDYSPGITKKIYTESGLKKHRKRTIGQVSKESKWSPGSKEWENDKKQILFFAQCLDRPAFRTYFHQELIYVAFDRAIEDSLLAFNTGYWRTRDGVVIERGKGKLLMVNPEWRNKINEICSILEEIRNKFSQALGLNRMLYEYDRYSHPRDIEDLLGGFRGNRSLGDWMNNKRREAIDIMNSLLDDLGSGSFGLGKGEKYGEKQHDKNQCLHT